MKIYHALKLISGGYSLADVLDYFRGNYRYWLYYHFPSLIRAHIREQIDFRVKMMRPVCYEQGYCEVCYCDTINLQMANKACEGNCYPEMMTAYQWRLFKQENVFIGKHFSWKAKVSDFSIPDLKDYIIKFDNDDCKMDTRLLEVNL